MARHRSTAEKAELGEQARRLRAAGRSAAQIRLELGIGAQLAQDLLRGVVVPDVVRRHRAKDELHAQAVELRRSGATYREIATKLEVSLSTCSHWLRDEARPPGRRAVSEAGRRRRRAVLDGREHERRVTTAAAAASVGALDAREVVLLLALSYWCEGGKSKPWDRRERIVWVNSDPGLVRLFSRGLDAAGVERDRLRFRVQIHESADEEEARRSWATVVDVPAAAFQRSSVKRHVPRTSRYVDAETYRGCLRITVLQSRVLYQLLDGFVRGMVAAADGSAAVDGPAS